MKRLFIAAALTLFFVVKPVEAQFSRIVFDPRNFAQNLQTAARTLTQINHQVTQIQNEIRMLENQAKNLERLPASISDQIQTRLFTIDTLMRSAEGISYQIGQIQTEYNRLYRESYGDNPPASPQIVEEANRAWRQSRQGYIHALQMQARVAENIRGDAHDLETVMDRSQGAAGNLQAVQAGNQINAITAQQMMQMQELLAAQYRAEALEQSRLLSEKQRGEARLKRFLGGTPYRGGR